MSEMVSPVSLWLVRHGECSDNAYGRFCGQRSSDLTEKGRRQAECAARFLKQRGISVVLTSPLSRAVETGRIISETCQVPLICRDELSERSFGQWEGLTFEQAQAKDPEAVGAWMSDPIDAVPPGGESLRQAAERVAPLIGELTRQHQKGSIAAVTHGALMRVMLAIMLEMPLELALHLAVANGSLSLVNWYGGTWVLDIWNHTDHFTAG